MELFIIFTTVRFRICGGKKKLIRSGLKRQRRKGVWNLGRLRGAEVGEHGLKVGGEVAGVFGCTLGMAAGRQTAFSRKIDSSRTAVNYTIG